MSAVTDAPHRLLLSHFSNWSQTKGRDVDVPLLESLLDLRAAYDDLEPTLWPAGSVQDLLLRLVPAKGLTDALAHWIQPRAEVTATGVLRPAAARQAFEALGLVAWWREWLRCDYVDRSSSEDIEIALESIVSRQSWRSARDCIPLDRLWSAAVACQVINIEGRWAYPSWPQELDDDGTVTLALRAGLAVLAGYLDGDSPFAVPVLGYALLRSYVRRPRSVPLEEIEEFVLSWILTPSQRTDPDRHDLYRGLIRSTMRLALYGLDDLGIFFQTKNEIALTAWGDVYVANWLAFELGEPSVEA